MRYEYKTLTVECDANGDPDLKAVNEQGAMGWRVVNARYYKWQSEGSGLTYHSGADFIMERAVALDD